MYRIFVAVLLSALLITGCSKAENSQDNHALTVSAAASLADVLEPLTDQFTQETGIPVHLNFASSGTLEKQIEAGASADLFFSAAENYTNQLIDKGLADKKWVKPLVSNKLVLIVPKNSDEIHSIDDLAMAKVIAIGTPELVPAGEYAKEALTSLHLWGALEAKMVYGKDVRQVLSYVETGNADAGLVYLSDAETSTKVKTVQVLPDASHQLILYPCAIIKNSDHQKEAKKLFHYLQSKTAMQLFKKYGFEPLVKE
jgi:molybdate transport system substrate-binding protein